MTKPEDRGQAASASLTEGPVAGHLVRLTGPMSLGVLSIMTVGIADAYFLGRLGQQPLAAISFIYPVTIALTSLGIGLSAGASSVVSRALGAEDEDGARRLSAHAVLLAGAVGLAVCALGLLVQRPLFVALQAQAGVMPLILAYMPIWLASFPILVITMCANAILRSHGDTLWPAASMGLTAVINIVLNPVFIFGFGPIPELGIAGAGWATLIARICGLFLSLWLVLVLKRCFSARNLTIKNLAKSVTATVSVGGPAAFSNAINPAGMAAVTAIIAQFGEAAVAGFGAAGRIQSFALVVLLGLSGSIGPIVGQNWGAKKYDRVARAYALACAFCLLYGLALAVALFVGREQIAGVFDVNGEVGAVVALYLAIVPWTLCGYGVLIVTNASMNARGKPLPSTAVSLSRIAILYVPLAVLGGAMWEETGVFAAAAVANLVAGAAAAFIAWCYLLARRQGLTLRMPRLSPSSS